jgi:tyrosyl-tRNA synthetase
MSGTSDPAAQARSQLERLRRGTDRIIADSELEARLERSLRLGRPLRVKLGVDPTSPMLHLGFTVVLGKLRTFQDLGHQAVLIIGDATALVGDPTGRNRTRPRLSPEEVEANARTYLDQAGRILDLGKAEIRRNSEWLGRLDLLGLVDLAARTTVARLLERNDFQERFRTGTPIHVHELLYPLLQGWDSVQVRSDVELGGSDQLFNLLVGRDLQTQEGQEPQVCLTTPLLVGLDGHQKMSKSLGNAVGITEAPLDMAIKIMRVPDALLRDWFLLLTDLEPDAIAALLAPGRNPRDAKLDLVRFLVGRYHGAEAGNEAALAWVRAIGQRDGSTAPAVAIPGAGPAPDGSWPVQDLLLQVGFARSRSEARRYIAAGSVSLDGEKVTGLDARLRPRPGSLLRVGRQKACRVEPREP